MLAATAARKLACRQWGRLMGKKPKKSGPESRAILFRLWLGNVIGIVVLAVAAVALVGGLIAGAAVPAAVGASLLTALVKVTLGDSKCPLCFPRKAAVTRGV